MSVGAKNEFECKVCQSKQCEFLYHVEEVPIYNLEVHRSFESAVNCKSKPASFYICINCGFVFNKDFDQSLMHYAVNYEAGRGVSPYFKTFLNEVSKALVEHWSLSKKDTVVEVGCGNAEFLKTLLLFFDGSVIGYEPSINNGSNLNMDRLAIVNDYFSFDDCNKIPDVLVLRHILEHQSDPYDFLKSLFPKALGQYEMKLYIEVPCWEWIVEKECFNVFSYEHCSYYNKSALKYLLSNMEMRIEKQRFCFDGEYLQSFSAAHGVLVKEKPDVGQLVEDSLHFAKKLKKKMEIIREEFLTYADVSCLWGSAGKGTTLLNMLNLRECEFSNVVDINPKRQHTYISRTGQRVIDPSDLHGKEIKRVYVTNILYLEEIRKKLDSIGMNPSFYDVNNVQERIL